jgi:hypothetical protein
MLRAASVLARDAGEWTLAALPFLAACALAEGFARFVGAFRLVVLIVFRAMFPL